jgi:hypothetical protein
MIEWGDKLLTLAGVPPEKLEECLEWAFGKVDPKESLIELAVRWNQKHSDIFLVSRDDNPKAFVWSVGKAYVLRILPDHKIIVPRGGYN